MRLRPPTWVLTRRSAAATTAGPYRIPPHTDMANTAITGATSALRQSLAWRPASAEAASETPSRADCAGAASRPQECASGMPAGSTGRAAVVTRGVRGTTPG
ncbi:hypothetical protein GCM10010260_70590 [Streptomyces filipinensis]|uniref:Uncharacterized protein n=1 Tax=Streptomyces filipinensis TaxID=66887 RepID=A0A918MFH4_9ACTN|nr:hypothetical protein GCM10010260_70590 [Streptomyces filipinensis]